MLLLPPFCRSQPVNSFVWGSDTVISVRFNPGEPNLLASSARYTAMLISMLKIE
jgi:DDB1- and CUL4-associated factor 13